MHWNLFRPLFFLAVAPTMALAQTQSPAQDGRAGAPAASGSAYQSAFADYKPYSEPVLMPWSKANDQVRDTGSMGGHDMATMKPQSEDPHAGHDMSKTGASHAAHGTNKAQAEDPHAGHDMSTMRAPPGRDVPGAPHKANHGAHGAAPANRPTNKREKK